ncbi:MAG TPA: non-canonical purine NTP pyrophosphatase [Pirellulales bacterium]
MQLAKPILVLGTYNRKKGLELADLVAPLGIAVRTLSEFSGIVEAAEMGDSFAENAAIKATYYARQLEHWVLADDSGLCVDALGGRPGVHSARYAGEGAGDEDNNQRLLDELAGVPDERRTAHYVCHAALADPSGVIRAKAEESCRGRILAERRGGGGFGYDPLFEIIEYHRTFGELAPAVKACLSHRARALRKLLPEIERLK